MNMASKSAMPSIDPQRAAGPYPSILRLSTHTQPAVSKPQTINPAVSIVLILSEVLVVG